MTPDPNDLRRRLLYWAENKPNAPAFTYLERGEKITAEVTFAGLLARAQTISAQLQDRQLAGQTAVLLYPPGLSFVEAFFGCILANVIAVPVPHPVNVRARQRIAAIATAALPAVVLSLGRYCRDAGLREDIGPADVYPLWMPTDE